VVRCGASFLDFLPYVPTASWDATVGVKNAISRKFIGPDDEKHIPRRPESLRVFSELLVGFS
jgi:hypothetical protein